MHKTIEQRLRDHFPILFNLTNSVDQVTYRKEYKTFIDDTISITNPILASETIRYQSILLYVALIFTALHLLEIKQFKIVDLQIDVSPRLTIVYACFIFLVSLAFSLKALYDYKRWSLIRKKHTEAANTLQELVMLGICRKQIEQHFWVKAFNMIGECYSSVTRAKSRVLPSRHAIEAYELTQSPDITPWRSNPELAPAIKAKEAWLNDLQSELSTVIGKFDFRCEPIFIRHEEIQRDPSPFKTDDSYNQIVTAYRESLEPWMIARNNLNDESLSHTLRNFTDSEEQKLLLDVRSIFSQLKNMRRMYITAEIALPILFAVFVPAWVIWGK